MSATPSQLVSSTEGCGERERWASAPASASSRQVVAPPTLAGQPRSPTRAPARGNPTRMYTQRPASSGRAKRADGVPMHTRRPRRPDPFSLRSSPPNRRATKRLARGSASATRQQLRGSPRRGWSFWSFGSWPASTRFVVPTAPADSELPGVSGVRVGQRRLAARAADALSRLRRHEIEPRAIAAAEAPRKTADSPRSARYMRPSHLTRSRFASSSAMGVEGGGRSPGLAKARP